MAAAHPVVAVIDSGVQHRHPHLRHVTVRHLRLNGGGTSGCGTARAPDGNGHGTAVAAAVASHVPGGEMLSVPALDARLEGTLDRVIDAIDLARCAGATVINLSLGVSGPDAGRRLEAAVREAARAGVWIVAAADRALRWPGDLCGVLSAVPDARCPPDGLRPHPATARQPDGRLRDLPRFGAHGIARPPRGGAPRAGNLAGASLASAHLAGLAWGVLAEEPCATLDELVRALARRWPAADDDDGGE